MNTFKEINDTRKKGEIDKAYAMAQQALLKTPDDIWIKRAMSWVLYDKSKTENNLIDIITEVVALGFDSNDEGMFIEHFVWNIAKNVSNQQQYSSYINDLFIAMKPLNFTASEGYSYLFKTFHAFRNEWHAYTDFCDWWNFDNFLSKDYDKFRTQYGKDIMSLAEQAYIGYSKALLSNGSTEKIKTFLPKLKKLADEHKNYQYPPYFLAKLYLKINDKASAQTTLLPFVRNKSNDYWVWQTLGEACNDEEQRFYCYCKALTCNCKPEMLVSLKEDFAEILAKKGLFDNAKTEIEQVLEVRKQKSWRITDTLLALTSTDWYKTAQKLNDNKELYHRHAPQAEEITFADLTCISIMITRTDSVKKIANFITPERKEGMFVYSRLFKKAPEIGSLFSAYFSEINNKGVGKVVKINASTLTDEWNNIIIDFEGIITLDKDRRFGIVMSHNKNIFVPKSMLTSLDNTDIVSGKAVKSFDKKKNKDGWTAFKITKNK